MNPCILMRPRMAGDDELEVAQRHFSVFTQRAAVPTNSLVVGRFANLPYHLELENDIQLLGSRLVNTTGQHGYVADFDYYWDLEGRTFASWTDAMNIPRRLADKPFVVKGTTNSDKRAWSRRMFAPNLEAAHRIAADLRTDAFIGPQGVVYREYVPLEVLGMPVADGPPMANEWRTFYYKGQRLAHGFYWSNIDDWGPVDAARADFEAHGQAFADQVAADIANAVPFVCIDVAKTQDGRWLVVELNDGCMAGLNESVPAEDLYKNLRACLDAELSSTPAPSPALTVLEDKCWYWVDYRSFGEVLTAPAQYRADVDCFYSSAFSGIPAREVEVLRAA